jgi:hypothetical protein
MTIKTDLVFDFTGTSQFDKESILWENDKKEAKIAREKAEAKDAENIHLTNRLNLLKNQQKDLIPAVGIATFIVALIIMVMDTANWAANYPLNVKATAIVLDIVISAIAASCCGYLVNMLTTKLIHNDEAKYEENMKKIQKLRTAEKQHEKSAIHHLYKAFGR